MRTFTRAPITVKMPPRMPVNTAVGMIITVHSSCLNARTQVNDVVHVLYCEQQ
jgi:hypothetical protein